jgi:GGDEF domain-containing protein
MYFVIDDSNIYHRGDYVYILLAICLLVIIYTAAFIVKNRKKIGRKEYMYLLFFGIPPAIGGIIQYFFYGVVLIWICATVSILIIFVNIQNDHLHRDYLTGLYNRRSLDSYLSTRIKNRNSNLTAGIMIDLDSFKIINDLYGHHSGDQALKSIASILKNTFRKKDFIARYGGDEFIVLMEI